MVWNRGSEREQVEDVIETAKIEALKIIDEILADCEQAKKEARQEGYDKGYEEGYIVGKDDGKAEAKEEFYAKEKVKFT